MVHILESVFRLLYRLYIESIDILMSLQHQRSHDPITDFPQPLPVETYLDILTLSIKAAPDPLKAAMKSQVTRIRMGKEIKALAQHEYTLVELQVESQGTYHFRIERTRGAQPQRTIEDLIASDDPELSGIGNQIQHKIGLQVEAPEKTTSSPATKPSMADTPVSDPQPPFVSYPSRLESFSANAVASFNKSKSTFSNLKPLHHADDLITRVTSFDPPAPDVTLHEIRPENLTWLQFILIINIVRSEDKLYSIFGSQCYLYSQLIFLLVQAKFCPGSSKQDPTSDSDSKISVHISHRLSYPGPEDRFIKLDKSRDGVAPGTWMNVLVTVINIPLLERLGSKFDSKRNDIHQNIEKWAEKAAKLRLVEDLEKEIAELRKKIESQAPTGGPTSSGSSSRISERQGHRMMSTLPRGLGLRTGHVPGTSTLAVPPPSFNSLRVPPPPVNQTRLDRLLLSFSRLSKHLK